MFDTIYAEINRLDEFIQKLSNPYKYLFIRAILYAYIRTLSTTATIDDYNLIYSILEIMSDNVDILGIVPISVQTNLKPVIKTNWWKSWGKNIQYSSISLHLAMQTGFKFTPITLGQELNWTADQIASFNILIEAILAFCIHNYKKEVLEELANLHAFIDKDSLAMIIKGIEKI